MYTCCLLPGFLNFVADLSARIASENRRIEMYIDTKFMGVGWCWVSSVEVQRRSCYRFLPIGDWRMQPCPGAGLRLTVKLPTIRMQGPAPPSWPHRRNSSTRAQKLSCLIIRIRHQGVSSCWSAGYYYSKTQGLVSPGQDTSLQCSLHRDAAPANHQHHQLGVQWKLDTAD